VIGGVAGWRRSVAVITAGLGLLAVVLPAARAQDVSGPPPVYPADFPDPFVLRVGATYYAFATNAGANVPVLRSTDLVHWQPAGDALPVLARWAILGRTWAPAALPRGQSYVLYYSAHDGVSGKQCISRAVGLRPEGPYVDLSTAPLLCQVGRGGSIDPNPFVEGDGTAYLQWKSEGVPGHEPPRIWSQRLSADGLNLVDRAAELAHPDLAWEGGVIEGPSLVKAAPGRYWLLYSGNYWASSRYAVGAASCSGPLGPCRKLAGPVLASAGATVGPGGQAAFTDTGGAMRLAYHAWTAPRIGYPQGVRTMHLERLTFPGGSPVVTR